MNIIIRKAKVVSPKSSYNNQIVDIKVNKGIIQDIGIELKAESDYQEIVLNDLHVSEGWFDESVCLGEPGYEERETIQHGLTVAAKSGFTSIGLQPNTYPVVDNQAAIQFALSKAQGQACSVYPIGALTKKSEGNDMAELFDMKNAGAIAFGDYKKGIANPMILKIALQYVRDFNGLVVAFAQDKNIRGLGVAREGEVSTYLGLKGIPAMADELQISRNLFLLEYTGGKLHIPTISTKKSVVLIREAKAKGLQVTCSVAVHHLIHTDEVLREFDTRYKVMPPIGTEEDRQALIDGVLDGTIDSITSDHNPIDIEYKKMDFDSAMYGTIGLESAYGALQTVLPTDVIVNKLNAGKSIFGIENQSIEVGQKANITLFTPTGEGEFSMGDVLSKSKNSAFLGVKTQGKVYGVYNNEQLVLNK
ncbi:MAG: dihydroorotase [Flavobacteriales bacterium]|nr:dihydroorotase [Flavobacteriales bacterium]